MFFSNKNKKEIRLYDVLFPVWILMIWPVTWIIFIPGIFLINTIVLFIGTFVFKVDDKLAFYKRKIFPIFIFGLLSQFLGSALLMISQSFDSGFMYEFITAPMLVNPYDNVYSMLYTILAVLISGLSIYLLNRFVTFRKFKETKNKRLFALLIALLTVPYLFLLPTSGVTGEQNPSFTNHFVWYDYNKAEIYLKEDQSKNILDVEAGTSYRDDLVIALREGINIAKKDNSVKLGDWDYKVVFYKNGKTTEKMEPIYFYEYNDDLYFVKGSDSYVLPEEHEQKFDYEINYILNPPVITEE